MIADNTTQKSLRCEKRMWWAQCLPKLTTLREFPSHCSGRGNRAKPSRLPELRRLCERAGRLGQLEYAVQGKAPQKSKLA